MTDDAAGRSSDGTERKAVYQCYECGVGMTTNQDRRCEECGCRDWMEMVA